jgi:hypothetical protein
MRMFRCIDSAIPCFDELRDYSALAKFDRTINEIDGADYPAICQDIPEHIKSTVVSSIEKEVGFKIEPQIMFLRANEEGASEPYQAHNDLNMGDHTFILYLTSDGGTSFVKHKETGVDRNVDDFGDTWLKDCNDYGAWEVVGFCQMKPNRALFFDAEMMHRGEPVDGYGSGKDARMILVCFYNRASND